MRTLADLWHGRLPLARAFWTHAVLIGLALNVAATGGMLAALAAGLPAALALAVHLSPLPYYLACAVGVWRSAAGHEGPPHEAELARAAVIVWVAVLLLV